MIAVSLFGIASDCNGRLPRLDGAVRRVSRLRCAGAHGDTRRDLDPWLLRDLYARTRRGEFRSRDHALASRARCTVSPAIFRQLVPTVRLAATRRGVRAGSRDVMTHGYKTKRSPAGPGMIALDRQRAALQQTSVPVYERR
jgi:hypothetical protein